MNRLLSNLMFLTVVCYSKADLCQANLKLKELPQGIVTEITSMLTQGIKIRFVGCPKNAKIDENSVKLLLYTRNNQDDPIRLDVNKPDNWDSSKKIKMILPGWLCNITNTKFQDLKNAYLDANDYNVIMVEWSTYAIDLYVKSYCYVPVIAQLVSRFFCNIYQDQKVDLKTVHLIGHSLGAQMSGWIGQEVESQCEQKVGRITGLDPAGPIYQGISENRRLDETDAEFVDVIHTNQNYLGYYGKAGKVDFYPNCGTFQSGCWKDAKTLSGGNLINLATSELFCNHERSLDFMIESVHSDKFVSKSCRLCPGIPFLGVCMKDILFASTTIMGENADPNAPYKKFYLKTNKESPFARG